MKRILAAAALFAATTWASAAAIPGSLTILGYEHGTAPSGTMTINPPGLFNTTNVQAAVSGLNVSFDDGGFLGGQDFLAWCIELMAPTGNFGVARDYSLIAPPETLSATQNTRLTNLFIRNFEQYGGGNSFVYGFGSTADATHSAAMQLAIWEIIYDEDDFGDLSAGFLNLGAGEFYSTKVSGARALAEEMMAGLDTYTTGVQYNLAFSVFSDGKGGLQDFLTVEQLSGDSCTIGNDCDPVTEVPEPGSLALAAGGLALLAIRRKKPQSKA